MALESYNQPNTPFPAESLPFILTMIDALEEPVFVKDEQHRFVLVNDVLCRLVGKSREELLGHRDDEFFPPSQVAVFVELDRFVLDTGETRVNEEQITWHGEEHTIQTTKQRFVDPASGRKFVVGTIKDITGRQDSVAALIGGWAAMQRVLEDTGTVLFEQDLDLRYDRFFSAHPVFPKENYLGKTDYNAHQGDEGDPLIELKKKVIATGEPGQHEVFVTAGAKRYCFKLFVAPRRRDGGEITGVLCSALDVTHEKEVLRSLESNRERFQAMFNEAPIPIVLARETGVIVEVNRAMVQFLEYDSAELTHLEEPPFSFKPGDLAGAAIPTDRDGSRDVARGFERQLRSKSGKQKWADVTIAALSDESSDGHFQLVMLRDVSAQRHLVQQLRRRENILNAVTFVAEQFLREPEFDTSILPSLERLGQATNVSRVHVFENSTDSEGVLRTRQRFEWVNEGITPEIENPDLQNVPLTGPLESIRESLSRGEMVYGRIDEFSPELQAMLDVQGIRSIVLVPLFVGKKWWGMMGFDECLADRRWSDLEIDALKAAAGIIGAAVGRSEALRALSTSEIRWRSLVDNDPDGILELDAEGRVLFINRPYPGFTKAEVVGRNVLDLISPDYRAQYRAALDKAKQTGDASRFTVAAVSPGGTESWWSCRAVWMTGERQPGTYLVLGTNITGLKEREQELAESREQYRMLIENQRELIVKIDFDGHYLFASPSYCRTFGLDHDDVDEAHSIWELIHVDDRERCREMIERLQSPPFEQSIELRGKTPDGWRWFEWVGRALRDDDDRNMSLLAVGRDVTDRKQFEDALAESEARFRDLAETTNAAIFIYQGDDTVYANPAAAKITGYSVDELRSMSFWPMIHPDDKPMVAERARRRQAGEDVPPRYELRIIDKSGQARWLDFSGALVTRNGKAAVLGAALDITSKKNAEEAQKRLTAELRKQRESLQKEKYALERVVSQIEAGKREYKQQIGEAVKRVMVPMFERLRSAAGPDLKLEIDAASERLDEVLGDGTSVQRMRLSQLTGREWEICRLIQAGQSSKEIAESLNLSVMTIHKHRERIRKKLGLTSKNIDLSTFLNLYRDT